jgi:hypothetical protein
MRWWVDSCAVALGRTAELRVPYIYIDRVLNELRDELLTAMHAAMDRELRQGRVDVAKLYRAFTRAAANQVSNPVLVSDKCVETNTVRPKKGSKVRNEE